MVQDGLVQENYRGETISGTTVQATSGTIAALGVTASTITTLTSTTGNITTVSATTVNGTTVSGTTVQGNTINLGGQMSMNMATGSGTIINNLTAEAVISGGMWVVGSAASGTTLSVVAKPAPASTNQPLGICLATTGSGSNPDILVQGTYLGVVAEGTLNVGDGFSMGSGAKLNCVGVAAAGLTRGTTIMAGGSEATVGVYLW